MFVTLIGCDKIGGGGGGRTINSVGDWEFVKAGDRVTWTSEFEVNNKGRIVAFTPPPQGAKQAFIVVTDLPGQPAGRVTVTGEVLSVQRDNDPYFELVLIKMRSCQVR
jgi:hypothetical protein